MEINPIYDMVPFVAMINEMIQQAIRFVETYCYPEASIEYIDTLFSINGAVPAATPTGYTYLFGPNLPYYLGYLYADMNVPIADIHLTERGYLRVALSFIRAIEADFNFMHLFQAH